MADSKENYEWDLGSERVTKLWSDLTSFFFFVTSQLGSYTCYVTGSETPDCCLIHHRSDLKSFFFVLTTSQLGSYTCNVRGSETPDCCLIHHMIISFTAWSQQMWILLWCRDNWKDLL